MKLHDELVRLKLAPRVDFEFVKETDSIMLVKTKGLAKLVEKHYLVKQRGLHVSMLPDDSGVVSSALIAAADNVRQPGFWQVILDVNGRPVAEHPLTYSRRVMEPGEPSPHQPPPTASRAVPRPDVEVETTGDLARLMVSWMVAQDRVNDDEIAGILEILSVHALSPRDIKIPIKSLGVAQRLHDEILCFLDDFGDVPGAAEQATALRERIALLLTPDPVE